MGHSQGFMVDVLVSWSAAAGLFEQYGQQYGSGTFMEQHSTLQQ